VQEARRAKGTVEKLGRITVTGTKRAALEFSNFVDIIL
jgi:hypothetical protein